MIIVSKDKTSIANMDHISCIYVAGDYSIKANMNGNVSMIRLGMYGTQKAAEYAFQFLLESLSTNDKICYMPQDGEVQAKEALNESRYRNINGKKTKGHGGS